MRLRVEIAPILALIAWLAAVGWPALALPAALAASSPSDVTPRNMTSLLATTTLWALSIALLGALVGWAPGRLLGRGIRRRAWLPLAAAMLAPVCLPAYVIFYAWWQSWPGDSALYRWAVENDHVPLVKGVTLLAGFVGWSWPLAAWCVAGYVADTPGWRQDLLRLEGAGPLRRLADRLRCDGRGLALAALVVFLFVFGNTASFDIAQFFTFGYELKAIDALDASPRQILAAALPAIAVAAAGAAGLWVLLGHRPREAAVRGQPAGRGPQWAAWMTAAVWMLSVALPVALFAGNLGPQANVGTFVSLYGRDCGNTLGLAVACGALAALVTVGLAVAWQDHRPWMRAAAGAMAIGWLVTALVPGTVVAVALEAAYNRPGLDDVIYTTPAILVIGFTARFAFVGALLARWLALGEPQELADLRRLEGPTDLPAFARSAWPRLAAGGGAAFAIAATLSMSELTITARLQPPGLPTIATAVLNAVHYQRPDTVLLAVLGMIGFGVAAGLAAAAAWLPLRRHAPRLTVAGLCVAGLAAVPGCGASGAADEPLDARLVFGRPGTSLGQFSYPRGIAVDAARGVVYVVDKTARVQRFDFAGEPQLQWRMPQWENGKPTGLGVAPDGNVWVADTHYHRVIVYDPDGNEVRRFGHYGQGPGEFIFPTDVAFGPDGRVYVSEYGGNERIGVFDAEGEFLFSFGGPGPEVGRYNRPQAMAFSRDGRELYIADACNHRVVVTTPEGEPLRVIGGPGRGPGQLAYPYDVMVLDDGTLLVSEFGNNRIQHVSPQGACLGLYGRAGTGEGELRFPWGVDGAGDRIFVLDSGNNRVQVLDW